MRAGVLVARSRTAMGVRSLEGLAAGVQLHEPQTRKASNELEAGWPLPPGAYFAIESHARFRQARGHRAS